MNDDNVVELRKPAETVENALVCVLRRGAQELLARAVEEARIFLESYTEFLNEKGQRQVVRNGYLPERSIQTGIGSIPVKIPRIRDRSGSGLQYTSRLVPRYLRKRGCCEQTNRERSVIK